MKSPDKYGWTGITLGADIYASDGMNLQNLGYHDRLKISLCTF